MVRVFWLGRAENDLDQIAEYIVERDVDAAIRMVGEIRQRVALLAEQPGMGRAGRVSNTRELVVARTPYIVVYTVDSILGNIVILRVLHSARRWPKTL